MSREQLELPNIPLELSNIPCDQIFSKVMDHIRTYEGQMFCDVHGMQFRCDVDNVFSDRFSFQNFLKLYKSYLQQLFLYDDKELSNMDCIISCKSYYSLNERLNSLGLSDGNSLMNELSNEGKNNLDQILNNLTPGHCKKFVDIISVSDRREVAHIMNGRDWVWVDAFVKFLKVALDNLNTDIKEFTGLYNRYDDHGSSLGNEWLNSNTDVHEEDGDKN